MIILGIISFGPIIVGILIVYWLLRGEELKKYIFEQRIIRKLLENSDDGEFEHIYENLMNSPQISEVKKEYKKNMLKFLSGVVLSILSILTIIGQSYSYDGIDESLITISVIMFLVGACLFTAKKRVVSYKDVIIKNLIMGIEPNILYRSDPVDLLYKDMYAVAGFKDWISSYPGVTLTDYMRFETENSRVTLAELLLKNSRYRRSGMKFTVFSGIIVNIFKEKMVENEILIEKDRVVKRGRRIIDTNERFEKYFDIYSIDSVGCNEIVTEQVKSELVELYERYGIMFEISLKNKCIYIRFFTGKLFASKGWRMLNKKQLYREYIIFKNILQIINKINEIF